MQQSIHHAKTSKESSDEIEKFIKQKVEEFSYWAKLIDRVNTNTYIPPFIRDKINMLLHQGIKPVSNPSMASTSINFLKNTTLDLLDGFIDSSFVKDDKDKAVQSFLKVVKDSRNLLIRTIDPRLDETIAKEAETIAKEAETKAKEVGKSTKEKDRTKIELSKRKFIIIIVFSILIIAMGITSAILAFEIRMELDHLELKDLEDMEPEARKELESKTTDFFIEFGFALFMIPLGIKALLGGIFNQLYGKVDDTKERKLAFFQTQFGFGILLIAVLVSFSIQSMNDNRYEWMYTWGISSMIGAIVLIIYRERNLHRIFDKDSVNS